MADPNLIMQALLYYTPTCLVILYGLRTNTAVNGQLLSLRKATRVQSFSCLRVHTVACLSLALDVSKVSIFIARDVPILSLLEATAGREVHCNWWS